jgi:cytochrome c2
MLTRYRKLYLGVLILLGVSITAGVGSSGNVRRRSALPTAMALLASDAPGAKKHYYALQSGRALSITECTTCHRFFFPYEYPSAIWPAIMKSMGRKSNISKRHTGDITRYMVAASRLTRGGSGAGGLEAVLEQPADPATVKRGKALAETNCVGCHRYYRPNEFAPAVWPGIVLSMGELESMSYDEMRAMAMYFVSASRKQTGSDD